MAAILRYNNSMAYAQNVLGWAAAYATGVVPVDLPPIVGPPPPIGDRTSTSTGGPRARPAAERHRRCRPTTRWRQTTDDFDPLGQLITAVPSRSAADVLPG